MSINIIYFTHGTAIDNATKLCVEGKTLWIVAYSAPPLVLKVITKSISCDDDTLD